jgi:hypothetical protein
MSPCLLVLVLAVGGSLQLPLPDTPQSHVPGVRDGLASLKALSALSPAVRPVVSKVGETAASLNLSDLTRATTQH